MSPSYQCRGWVLINRDLWHLVTEKGTVLGKVKRSAGSMWIGYVAEENKAQMRGVLPACKAEVDKEVEKRYA